MSVEFTEPLSAGQIEANTPPALGPPASPTVSATQTRSDDAEDDGALLPVRMLNEFTYCPRLFHLMYVEGRWADNVYTVEGKAAHRRVDKIDHLLPGASSTSPEPARRGGRSADTGETPAPHDTAGTSKLETENSVPDSGDDPPVISRSVPLSSDRLGITAKLDLVSTAGDEAVPVETKRGRVPTTPERSYEPERVQLMAQGLLLREHGYRCDHGVLYFAASRTRVDVPFTPELEARTISLIEQARQAAHHRDMPLPLDDSPKCNACSLNAICLPDETLALQEVAADPVAPEIRRLYPMQDDALPFYVQEQGATVGKSGETLIVRKGCAELARARLKDTSQLVLFGNVMVSAQAVHLLCEAGVPVVHLSSGNWFYGITAGIGLRNAYDRAAQFAAAARPDVCVALARDLVEAKGANQRTLLRRNAEVPQAALTDMSDLIARVPAVTELPQLLGLEGSIAAIYFRHFSGMLRPRDFDAQWDFKTRNRRPPRDPVNAMLSFCYALLTKEATAALLAEGLDPWWGLYHQPRHGRPALALDLIEPFRAVVADSAVITAVNTGMVQASDFTSTAAACMLNAGGRKAIIRAYEGRLDQLVTHPVFGYRCSWRAMIRVQARLLARWFRRDIPEYHSIVTR